LTRIVQILTHQMDFQGRQAVALERVASALERIATNQYGPAPLDQVTTQEAKNA
jgi:hypothetical protein